ncbi:MAG: RDD family protein [Cyclobacteriaceae bacterium]|nr:RDD family protein [Cyclobacteriaceae bacterium]
MNKLNSGTRIGTMLLDHFIMTFVMMIVIAPGMVYDMMQTFGNPDAQPKLFLGNIYLNVLGFSLYFNKDIILGRSPAKRILKLQVIDIKTNKPANPLKCFVRNLTTVLWPIEVLVGLINNERRIGDYLAGTKLTIFNPDEHKAEINWTLVIIALMTSALATYLTLFYPMELLFKNIGQM